MTRGYRGQIFIPRNRRSQGSHDHVGKRIIRQPVRRKRTSARLGAANHMAAYTQRRFGAILFGSYRQCLKKSIFEERSKGTVSLCIIEWHYLGD